MRTILAQATMAVMIFTASLAQAQSYNTTGQPQPQPYPQQMSENQIRPLSIANLPQKTYPPAYYDAGIQKPVATDDNDATTFINVLRQLNNF